MSSFIKNYKLIGVAGVVLAGGSGLAWAVSSNRSETDDVQQLQQQMPGRPWDKNWDRREPSSLIKPVKGQTKESPVPEPDLQQYTAKANRHLILIRHGQYNTAGLTDEQKSLTELGRTQASLTGDRLKALALPYAYIIHSSMTRARETADIIHGHLPHLKMHVTDLLCEGAPFPPEPPSVNWKPEHKFLTEGTRIEAAFRKYFHRAKPQQETDSYEIIVCHANVIRYFVCRALQLPPEAWLRMTLDHASVTWITIKPNGYVSLRSVGDAGHMPPDKKSHL